MVQTEQKVKNYIDAQGMLPAPGGILIGLSGGADSVALFLLLRALYGTDEAFPITAVHVHHGIRGAEADRDVHFVQALCERYGVLLETRYVDAPAFASEHGLSEEEAGRELRYGIFEEIRQARSASYIAVAHNQNDVAETVLFHMARGSSLHGMTGIPPKRGAVIRPILGLTREEIEDYLAEKGESYCTDSTNADIGYDRNRIRHQVLPGLCEVNSGAVGHIARLSEALSETDAYLAEMTAQALEACRSTEKTREELIVSRMLIYPGILQKRMVYEMIAVCGGAKKDITERHIEACLALMRGETGKEVHLPYRITVKKNYDRLAFLLGQADGENVRFWSALEIPGVITLPDGSTLTATLTEKKTSGFEKNIYTKFFDYDKIKGTLCVRTPEDGDELIFSVKGSRKKLSRIFIDTKIDRDRREGWPVVACGGEILWAIGLRGSEGYRISEETKTVLILEYKDRKEDGDVWRKK